MKRNHVKDIIDELIYEVVFGKNPFKVGDLVKLRPDIVNHYHNDSNKDPSFHEKLKILNDKMGKVIAISNNQITVGYSKSANDKDIDSITVNYTDLVPYNEPVDESCGGGGYVYNKDMKKDPKHIGGERWRIKFQSSSDLKKHGNTEKSSINETTNPNEIREIIQELLKEMWIGFEEGDSGYQPKTGEKCHCKKGVQRDNCPDCEGTGWKIDFKKIRAINQHDDSQEKSFPMQETKEKLSESEHPDRKYVIRGKSGPITKYYVLSTQGDKMIANARSLATMFDTEEQTRNQIYKLSQKYPGITKWGFDTVNKNHREGPQPKHVISPPVKVGDEYIVKWITNGKRDEGKTYYTDDKQDALDTYIDMLKRADADNKAGR